MSCYVCIIRNTKAKQLYDVVLIDHDEEDVEYLNTALEFEQAEQILKKYEDLVEASDEVIEYLTKD